MDSQSLEAVGAAQYPNTEMEIVAAKPGWAEQHPDMWWDNLVLATKRLLADTGIDAKDIGAIGIAYQMHGLVVIDKDHRPLRPSIIWCDSRAVEIGNKAFQEMGETFCLSSLLNSPGNFTASKLKWVKDSEPAVFEQIDKVMLPGDYINLRLTGEVNTTISGLSEGILWDFRKGQLSTDVLQYFGFDESLFPEIKETFSEQGRLTASAAEELGLPEGIPVGYRSGDQPNNAMSLGVLKPGEVAATGGTSGVVFGVTDKPTFDPRSRVNSFAHVNYQVDDPSVGVLLCINGAGIQYAWMRKILSNGVQSYTEIEQLASAVPVNSDGLRILPFGNGAERMLENKDIGSQIVNLQLNRHTESHLYRATLEGIAYAFVYGMEIMKEMGISTDVIKVGNDNLFQSEIFSTTIASIQACEIQVIETNGAIGAAKAAGIGVGIYTDPCEPWQRMNRVRSFESQGPSEVHKSGYEIWKADLLSMLK